MSYGCKYRVPCNKSASDIQSSIYEDLTNFVKSKCRKYHIKSNTFSSWYDRVKEIVDKRLKFYENKHPQMFVNNVNILEKENVKKELKRLQNKYIICSIDKASNNFAFVCKKLYVMTLLKELGFNTESLDCIGNVTYSPLPLDQSTYIELVSSSLRDKFNINVEEDNMCLPRLFWNPKLHKDPYKARFIAGAKKCTTKPLNILVNCCLKLLRENFRKYCQTIYNNSGINVFWSIDSSTQFLDTLKNNEVYNLQIYDFTTLYTNLDLCEVDNMIGEVIDLIFSERNKYICICKYDTDKCFFSKKTYDGYHIFDKDQLKEAVHFIVYNTYIIFAGIVFIQVRGIPMGGNSSSPIADLTLAKREFNYMMNLMKNKQFALAKILSKIRRYVDDLITINYLNFQNLIKAIYPPSLEMERSGNDNKNVNYLDLNIDIKHNSISVSVFNKTDDFDFPVVSLTFPQSNIPMIVGYNVFYSQILRFGNTCTNLDTFTLNLNKLFQKLSNRGYEHSNLIQIIKRCLRKNNTVFRKYNISDDNTILSQLT